MTKDEKKKIIKENAVASILEYMKGQLQVTRKAILDNVTNVFLKKCSDKKVGGIKQNEGRSYVGTALTDLISAKMLYSKDGTVSKAEEQDAIIVDKTKCKEKLLALLNQKEYGKQELCALIIKDLGADRTKSVKDDNEIKSYIGQLLSQYVAEETVGYNDGKYSLKNKTEKTSGSKPLPESEFKPKFLARLHANGGFFFERFLANVIEKYYTVTDRTVQDCNVIGGSEDGGIDIQVKVSDDLGFIDDVMLQAKCRKNIQVTENEVRNFFGAINVVRASRGIYVTTSTFHPSADKLLHSLDNCVGIDGDGVFALAKKVQYGMKVSPKGYVFDDGVFDI